MEKRKLGYTGVELTTIGLGTWAIGGGGWQFGWGPQDDRESVTAIHRALDLGINWIDTARIYGLGHSEEIVGRAVRGRDVFVATKCGRQWHADNTIYPSLKADAVIKECESSLKRLQRETIDLYQIHWPDPDPEIEEGWSAIAKLIQEGKVRFGGVSNFNVEQLERAQRIHPIASLQPPYNMFARWIEYGELDYCARNGIGVVAYSPMVSGLLTGKFTRERVNALPADDWRRKSPHFQEPEFSVNAGLLDQLEPIARRNGLTLAQLAVAWVLRRPEVTSAIVGARKPEQIESTSPAAAALLSDEDLQEIETALYGREQTLSAQR